MSYPATYRERTRCPECHSKVKLEAVNFLPKFQCPNCGKDIRVSQTYQRTMLPTIWIAGLIIPYVGGMSLWIALLCWIPIVWVMGFLWTYAGKYVFSPKLERYVPKQTSILGLGSN